MASLSEPSPFASASLVFDGPVEEVSASFFDIDHAIEHEIHAGVTLLRLEPGPSGERVIRQQLRLQSRVQTDDFVIERVGDAWVKRFVGGPNAGARFVARFAAKPAGQTRVSIDALVASGGFLHGIGKLSALGMQKALQRFLDEHGEALRRRRGASVSSKVGRALARLGDLAEPLVGLDEVDRRAVSNNLLSAVCVVALADGEADDREREAIVEVGRALCGLELDALSLDRTLSAVASALETQGVTARCDKIGARLAALGVAELGLTVAIVVAQVSHGINDAERAAIERITDAAALSHEPLEVLLARAGSALRAALAPGPTTRL